MSDRLRRHLVEIMAAQLPPNVAAMRLLVEAASPGEADEAVRSLQAQTEPGSRDAVGLEALAAELARRPDAWSRVRLVLKEADHARGGGPAHWASVFDRLAAVAPDEAVALYALGSSGLAGATAAEIVVLLKRWRLVDPTTRVLDLGCGVGRLSFALAPHVGTVTGIDVSTGMVAEARRRGAAFGNVRFEATNGHDLADLAGAPFDLVLAVDVFPYLSGEEDGAERYVEGASASLAAGGALAIINYSYRGDDALDRAEIEGLFTKHGLDLVVTGERPLSLWDGLAFVGRKP